MTSRLHLDVSFRTLGKQQLFSTKPRLARSGSKPKVEKVAFPSSDSSISHTNDHPPHVEVIGRGYAEEKTPARRFSNGNIDEKQPNVNNKSKAKIIKGNSSKVDDDDSLLSARRDC